MMHSPIPWRLDVQSATPVGPDDGFEPLAVSGQTGRIYATGRTAGERDNDIRLMMSAPYLLQALERVLRHMLIHGRPRDEELFGVVQSAVDRAYGIHTEEAS